MNFAFTVMCVLHNSNVEGALNNRIAYGVSFLALATSAALLAPVTAYASEAIQTAPAARAAPPSQSTDVEELVVVGSQIQGAPVTGALPVSVVSSADIAATGAVSANELYRSIPQAGAVSFGNPSGAGQNQARGDVSTVSLRGLGLGTTLVLLNGRRVVAHPTTVNLEQSYNVNAIPVGGIERLEILRDGAAALYGSDAIAGVVNTVLSKNLDGGTLDAQYGFAEGTSLKETSINGSYGGQFAGGRGRFSALGSVYWRDAQRYGDMPFTAVQDVRSIWKDPAYATVGALDSRYTQTPWGQFQTLRPMTVSQNGVALTSAAGIFHMQPTTNLGCQAPSATPGVCFDDGASTSEADRNFRLDNFRTFPGTTVTPRARRANVFLFSNYDLTEDVELFTEAGYYYAETRGTDQPAQLSGNFTVNVAADAYWNPFGVAGSPNRLPGLNIPDSGVPLRITGYVPIEAGPRRIDVTNHQYRFLAGLKGKIGDFNWETAALYSGATVKDVGEAISLTLFQAAVNGKTPAAYNPFNGGDPANPAVGDVTLNSPQTVRSFIVDAERFNKSTLALADFKVSNANLLPIWAGAIGMAAGVEVRRETFLDDRPDRLDGTIPFIDSVSGVTYVGDLAHQSPRSDVSGKRTVVSAFAELAVPIISPDMGVPLVRALDFQLAGRYERFSDVGDVVKPKIAGAWEVFDGLKLRGSWSGGFRAPVLEVVNAKLTSLSSTNNLDHIQCEADIRAGRITRFQQCTRNFTLTANTTTNPDIKPETSTARSFGFVFQPTFIPAEWGRFTFTADRFRIEQDNVVSQLNNSTLLALDYLARVQGGSTDAVIRAAVTDDDRAQYAGTGIAPVGQPLGVISMFDNLLPLKVEGLDMLANWVSPPTEFGRFNATVSASKLISYMQEPLEPQQRLLDAQAAGIISNGFVVSGAQELAGLGTRPKWRGTASLTWTYENIQIGSFAQYIGSTRQTNLLDANNRLYQVKDQLTFNLYSQYTFSDGRFDGLKVTVGARNIFDKYPPLAVGGYQAGLYLPQGRYWYAGVGYRF